MACYQLQMDQSNAKFNLKNWTDNVACQLMSGLAFVNQ